MKPAFTVMSAELTVTWQALVPLHPPLVQPLKIEPELADAVRVTWVPGAKTALQPEVLPLTQEMPPVLLVTMPAPLPFSVTFRWWSAAKVAVTVVSALSVTVQVPVPGQVTPLPLQPVKTEPLFGNAVSVTMLPTGKLALQLLVLPLTQLIPVGLLLTVPRPAPASLTLSAWVGAELKVALTAVSAVRVKVQEPVPGHVVALPWTLQPA